MDATHNRTLKEQSPDVKRPPSRALANGRRLQSFWQNGTTGLRVPFPRGRDAGWADAGVGTGSRLS
jgi:hypothetical protein